MWIAKAALATLLVVLAILAAAPFAQAGSDAIVVKPERFNVALSLPGDRWAPDGQEY